MNKLIHCFIIVLSLPVFSNAQDTSKTENLHGWQIIQAKGIPEKREDCTFVEVNGLFYLIGGRGIKPVDVFNPKTNTWQAKGKTPVELNHFQAAAIKNIVYVLGAMNGGYPHEKPLENIYTYNTETDEWQKGPAMPAGRLRGSGGCVVYKGKLYLISGIQDGHYDGTVTWMDEFNPATGKWRTMPDVPHARDHFNAVVIGHKIYLASGRRTSVKTNQLIQLTVPQVDVFDFKKQAWETLRADQNLPTMRAGCAAVNYKNMLVVIGGESVAQTTSHREVEAFDTKTGAWNKLPGLVTGRHDTGALTYKNRIYIVAGSANRGGGPDQDTIEVLQP
jgi:N-acetylneuraminic acid mutarotase